MIVIEQCNIDSEGKYLTIEATVDNLSYYDDVYIKRVIIDTNNTYVSSGPSTTPIYPENYDPNDTEGYNTKHIRLQLTASDLGLSSLSDNIFFVYVEAMGTPSSDTPCGMDNKYVMSVAMNLRPIYNMAMSYIRELKSSCTTPKGFIDMILRLKAFELSLRTGNYVTALEYWDKLFKNKISVLTNKGCGCNGTTG